MHVCTPILIKCALCIAFARRQTLYLLTICYIVHHIVSCITNPWRTAAKLLMLFLVLLQLQPQLQLQLAIGIIAVAIFHRHLFPSQFLCNDLMCVSVCVLGLDLLIFSQSLQFLFPLFSVLSLIISFPQRLHTFVGGWTPLFHGEKGLIKMYSVCKCAMATSRE